MLFASILGDFSSLLNAPRASTTKRIKKINPIAKKQAKNVFKKLFIF
jgi:hypothetical protein